MSTGLYNGYPGGKKPISVIFKEKLKTGLMGGIMVWRIALCPFQRMLLSLLSHFHIPVTSLCLFVCLFRLPLFKSYTSLARAQGVGLGSGMGVMHTMMMRPPAGERMKLLKANCGRTAAFMGVLFGVGSAFRN